MIVRHGPSLAQCGRPVKGPYLVSYSVTAIARSSAGQWIGPSQAGEAREVAVARGKLKAVLDGERRQMSVWYEVAHDARPGKQPRKNGGMTFAR
jgi:hypothetical protein